MRIETLVKINLSPGQHERIGLWEEDGGGCGMGPCKGAAEEAAILGACGRNVCASLYLISRVLVAVVA